mgnify:CR=1 FL=1
MSSLLERFLSLAAGSADWLPLRSSLRAHMALLGQDMRVRERTPPTAQRVLVLAPHMDDEIFGCGGTLALAVRRGSPVTIAYLTDGRKGYDTRGTHFASEPEQKRYEDQLVERRKTEARAVGALLGFRPPQFLDFPDADLTATPEALDRVAQVVEDGRPDAVFLPFLTDPHPDHWATNRLFLEAAARLGLSDRTECWGYEVWAPLQANSTVDITDVMKEKDAAMEHYQSQAAVSDFRRAFQGLNIYRSLFVQGGRGYAEAFWVTDLARYRALCEALAHFGWRPSSESLHGGVL